MDYDKVINMPCPFINVCTKKVDFKHFNDICLSSYESDYEKCDMYKIYASDKLTPSQWKRITKKGW